MNITFKNKWIVAAAAVLVVALMTTKAHADTAIVIDQTSLQAALQSPDVSAIQINADFPVTQKIIINRPVTIDGGNHTVSFTNIISTTWRGDYIFEAYHTTGVTISNIKLTGGNAALLFNGSTGTLIGAIDVSGNGFGGIESSSSGSNSSILTVSGATITDSTESYGQPALWEDGITGTTVVGFNSAPNTTIKSSQRQYYLNAADTTSVSVSTEAQLNAALANTAITKITFANDIIIGAEVTVSRAVTIDGAGFTLSAPFQKTDNTNNAAIGILHSDVTVKNLIEDGSGTTTSRHGINIFEAVSNVNINDVTVENNHASGITVNGSTVTVNNITTKNNAWGGINADQTSDAQDPTVVTITGTSSQTETGPDIWKDDNTKDVTVNDPGHLYASASYTHDTPIITGTVYALKTVNVSTEAQLRAALSNTLVSTIVLSHDITLAAEITITRPVIIDGASKTLFSPFSNTTNDNSNNAGLGIIGVNGNVTISNLIVDGASGIKTHGINIFEANNVTLNNVTAQNNSKSGITVNGSTVTVNNITTKDNAWGGINADQTSDAQDPTVLTVTGTSSHTEVNADIWKDDNTKNVTILDTEDQYTSAPFVNPDAPTVTGTAYKLIVKESSTVANPQVVISDSTRAVTISVDNGTTNPSIKVTSTDGVATLPQINVTSADANVNITAGTTVTSTDHSWNGVINTPTVTTNFTLTPEVGTTKTAVLAIEVGAGDTPQIFSNAVKLTFPGQANNLIGWSQGGSFHAITNTCTSDTAPTLTAGADCRTDIGADLIVWTKHFTTFITYTQASNGVGIVSGGGRAPVVTTTIPGATVTTTTPAGQVLGAQSFHFTLPLKIGIHSDEVLQLQTRLNADGAKLVLDGKFGPKTKAALVAWQKAHKLSTDGIVGPKTRAVLNA